MRATLFHGPQASCSASNRAHQRPGPPPTSNFSSLHQLPDTLNRLLSGGGGRTTQRRRCRWHRLTRAQQQQDLHDGVLFKGELQPDELEADLVHRLAELIHGGLVHLLSAKAKGKPSQKARFVVKPRLAGHGSPKRDLSHSVPSGVNVEQTCDLQTKWMPLPLTGELLWTNSTVPFTCMHPVRMCQGHESTRRAEKLLGCVWGGGPQATAPCQPDTTHLLSGGAMPGTMNTG